MQSRHFLAIIVIATFACKSHASEAQDVQVVEQNNDRSGTAKFDYDKLSASGPANWGNISPDFAFCNKGQHQSPINLVIGQSTSDGVMPSVDLFKSVVQYKPSGRNYMFECQGGAGIRDCSTVRYYGVNYHMIQAHFHSVSDNHAFSSNSSDPTSRSPASTKSTGSLTH